MQPSFYLQMISRTQREREREREREHKWPPSQATAAQIVSPPPPKSRRPTAEIVPAKLPPFSLFFLNSSSPSCSKSLIWPPPTTSPLHFTPKPTLCTGEFPPLFEFCLSPTTSPHLRSAHLCPIVTLPHVGEAIPTYKSRPTLYKSRSTFPQTHLAKIHPQTHKQPINVFILIFGCVKLYILKFYVIKFVWKLRKCEKIVGK